MKCVGGYSINAVFAGNLNSKVRFGNWVILVWVYRFVSVLDFEV